jgi:hypothetical protein
MNFQGTKYSNIVLNTSSLAFVPSQQDFDGKEEGTEPKQAEEEKGGTLRGSLLQHA